MFTLTKGVGTPTASSTVCKPVPWVLHPTSQLPILEAESRLAPPIGPSPLQVGNIYQRFSSVEEGVVENIIELSTPFLLQERNGITVTVKAR